MRTIPNESALDAPIRPRTIDYIRSKCEPHVLIHPTTGEVYQRTDGLRWEWPAYAVTMEEHPETKVQTVTVASIPHAVCDTERYAPSGA